MGETSPDVEDRMTDRDLTLTPSRGDKWGSRGWYSENSRQ